MTDRPDAAFVHHGVEGRYKKLFFSDENNALAPPVSLQGGFGILEKGSAIAKNASAGGPNKGRYIPYDPAAITGAENAPARAYLLQDSGTAATDLFVAKQKSYQFAVGDDVYIVDDTTAQEQLGAITAIDRETYPHLAVITVTTATGATSFTTARFAYIAVEGADTCVGILPVTRDTGDGVYGKAAEASLVISNAMLYTGSLVNYDSDAETDMGSSEVGQLTVFK